MRQLRHSRDGLHINHIQPESVKVRLVCPLLHYSEHAMCHESSALEGGAGFLGS